MHIFAPASAVLQTAAGTARPTGCEIVGWLTTLLARHDRGKGVISNLPMALTELWKTAQKEICEKHIQQVIGFAGDGRLRDGGPASKEFREFLALVPSSFVSRYAGECLNDKFDSGGFGLEDVIKEAGKRLGVRGEHGRYRGTAGEIGLDGLRIAPDNHAV